MHLRAILKTTQERFGDMPAWQAMQTAVEHVEALEKAVQEGAKHEGG